MSKSIIITCSRSIKEEIQNWFNLISEERVNKIEQNSENLMKNG